MKRQTNIIISSITVILSGLLALLKLSEWYKVKILNRIVEYSFGSEGPYPYFYKTAELYSKVNLIWGLIFISILLISVWTIVKSKSRLTLALFILTILLLIVVFIHGLIGT
jgi:hypothetical protein